MGSHNKKPKIIAIGSSTGGPEALVSLFGSMKGKLDNVPVLVTQHIPSQSTDFLTKQIETVSGYKCHDARDGERIANANIYLAPADFHMLVESHKNSYVIKLEQGEKEHHCRPAIDPMVRSIVKLYGHRTVLIILTGMGKDGLDSAKLVMEKEGQVIIQDKDTSVVWGMPGTIAKAGFYTQMLPLDGIKEYLCQIL